MWRSREKSKRKSRKRKSRKRRSRKKRRSYKRKSRKSKRSRKKKSSCKRRKSSTPIKQHVYTQLKIPAAQLKIPTAPPLKIIPSAPPLKIIPSAPPPKIQPSVPQKMRLTDACRVGDEKLAFEIIKNRDSLSNKELFNPSQVDGFSNTSLIWACKNEMKTVVLKLLETTGYNDLNLHHVNKVGETALMWACFHTSMEEVVPLLLNLYCKTDHVDSAGCTSLFWALNRGSVQVALSLLDTDCNMNHITPKNRNALILACQTNKVSVALKLIEKGCYLDHKFSNGNTALVIACKNSMEEVALKLLEKGCQVDKDIIMKLSKENKLLSVYEKVSGLGKSGSAECAICYEMTGHNVVIQPCFHSVNLDGKCAIKLNECPYCRKKVSAINKVFKMD